MNRPDAADPFDPTVVFDPVAKTARANLDDRRRRALGWLIRWRELAPFDADGNQIGPTELEAFPAKCPDGFVYRQGQTVNDADRFTAALRDVLNAPVVSGTGPLALVTVRHVQQVATFARAWGTATNPDGSPLAAEPFQIAPAADGP